MEENQTPKKPRSDKHSKAATKRRQDVFLKAYRECGNVRKATEIAKIGRSFHYHWMERDPKYRERFELVVDDAADKLESEAWRRAHDGVKKPVYQQGVCVGYIQEYSDTLLIFLLKGLRPEKFRERQEIHQKTEHSGIVGFESVRNELMNDPQYTEYMRLRAANFDSGGICCECEPWQVADADAPASTRSSVDAGSDGAD